MFFENTGDELKEFQKILSSLVSYTKLIYGALQKNTSVTIHLKQ